MQKEKTGEFSFQGSGGVRISGKYFSPEKRVEIRRIILFHHGLWTDAFLIPLYSETISAMRTIPGTIVAAYDARGHGKSSTDYSTGEFSDYFSVEEMVSDVSIGLNFLVKEFCLEEKKDFPVYLVGHSLGGYVSLRVASCDSRIKGVVTLASPVSFDFGNNQKAKKFLEKALVEIPEDLHARLEKNKPIEFIRLKVKSLRLAEKSLLGSPKISSSIGNLVNVRVSFILGNHDILLRAVKAKEKTGELAFLLPNSKITVLNGEHHFFGFERQVAKFVRSELADFISEIEKPI